MEFVKPLVFITQDRYNSLVSISLPFTTFISTTNRDLSTRDVVGVSPRRNTHIQPVRESVKMSVKTDPSSLGSDFLFTNFSLKNGEVILPLRFVFNSISF